MLDAVFGRRDMDGVVNAVTAYDEGMAEIETRRRQIDSGGVRGISTGYTQLDAILGGWQKKTYVLAARPSVGKSALMVNWAVKAVGDGAYAIIFSTEMQRSEIIFRAASFLSGVPSEGFNSGRILPDDFHKLQAAREILRGFGDRPLSTTALRRPSARSARFARVASDVTGSTLCSSTTCRSLGVRAGRLTTRSG